MEITLTLKDMMLIIIGVGLIVLIGYFISLLKNLIVTIKHTNKILEDTEVITAIASERAKDIDKIIDDAGETVGTVADTLKGSQSTLKALTCVVNALGSLKNLINAIEDKTKK